MESIIARMMLTAVLLGALCPLARGQVSFEEAERRLREKLASRPSSTRPVTEAERLREENRRLREEVAMLEQEVMTLKEIIARVPKPTTAPTTQPATTQNAEGPEKALLGRWRGGDITAGTGYLIQFDADGTYKQMFVAKSLKETGQYRLIDDNTMEMWSDKWPENKKHNRYQVNATRERIILTPLILDGFEVRTPRAVVLRWAG